MTIADPFSSERPFPELRCDVFVVFILFASFAV
jgi:hypothetical protein